MEIIEIKNLTFTYPVVENAALSQINMTVEQGEFITLCGKSGCGKTTLLKLLKPAVSPEGIQDGEILFEGEYITKLNLCKVSCFAFRNFFEYFNQFL